LLTALYEKPRGPRLRAMRDGLRDGLKARTSTDYLPADSIPGGS